MTEQQIKKGNELMDEKEHLSGYLNHLATSRDHYSIGVDLRIGKRSFTDAPNNIANERPAIKEMFKSIRSQMIGALRLEIKAIDKELEEL